MIRMKPGIIMWDIDGVLVDVRMSYRLAITQTVQYYFTELVGLNLGNMLMTVEDTQRFKLAGRFNDDWKVTYASVLCFLTELVHERGGRVVADDPGEDVLVMVDELKKLGTTKKLELKPNLKEITKKIKREGGGLEGTKKALKQTFGVNMMVAEKFWFPKLIKKVFQELYLGEKLFKKKYGENPFFIKTDGLIRNEKPLPDLRVLKELRKKFFMGVATGRERFEAEFVLKKHQFNRFIPLDLIVSSEDILIGKPEPDQLLECRRRICKKYSLNEKETKAVYVGDSIDDVAASKNAGFQSIGCLTAVSGKEEKKRLRNEFQKQGCDLIVEDANGVLALIK